MSMIIPDWNAPQNVKAFASTRFDGFSTGAYQGLNLGMHVGDDASLVESNRAWLKQQSKMPTAPVWLNQTHSTDVVTVLEPVANVLDADGAFTTATGVVCSAMTADCLRSSLPIPKALKLLQFMPVGVVLLVVFLKMLSQSSQT